MTRAEAIIRTATVADLHAMEEVLVANETPTPDEPPFPLGVQPLASVTYAERASLARNRIDSSFPYAPGA
jgi:hypothetical protein